jgi:hypothetical protein
LVDDSLRASWQWQFECAHAGDQANGDNENSWVPSIMVPLVTAVHATSLQRLHPFTSHATLCLSTSPRCWETEARTAPAMISLDAAGHYNVWSAPPEAPKLILVLATRDPGHAAAELERILATWT